MAEMIPVGNTGVTPLQSLSQLVNIKSGMVGLQQQQQALQTGAYVQQQEQAKAQQDQQAMGERQLLQRAQQTGKDEQGNPLNDPETGEPDPVAYSKFAARALPLTGQAVTQNIVKTLSDKVGLSEAARGLNQNWLNDISGIVRAGVGQPASATASAITAYTEQNPGAAKVGKYVNNLVLTGGANNPVSKDAALHLSQRLQPAGTTEKEQAPSLEGFTNKQGQAATRQVNPMALVPTGEVGGAGAAQGLNPTQKLDYQGALSATTSGAATRATGVGNADVDRANQVSSNLKTSVAGIRTTQQIDDLADQIHSGEFASWVSKAAAAAGVKEETYARQLLEKDLGIVRTQLTAAAPSDARAATILSGTPDAKSDPQTIHGAMDYVRGGMRQNVAQGQNLNAYRAKRPDLTGFQAADDKFTGAAGPLVHEFLALKSNQEKASFVKRNFTSREQAQTFMNEASGAGHVLGLQ